MSNNQNLKRPLSLDFNKTKRQNANLGPLLSSPDLRMLKVGTPELEKIILDNPIQNTPTPSQGAALLFPRSATEEQEQFSAGFEVALNKLHNSQSQDSNSVYSNSEQESNGATQYASSVKEEQTVPSNSAPSSPIDMEHQERIKLERKRMRNRLAASKCRSRKLERIAKLQDKVKGLKGENAELTTLVTQMRERVNGLKVEVLDHVNNGCQIVV